ncbi:hypothetical protein LTR35_012211 [Friedmanniomyces endolithicus]|uniref:Cellulase n=1 Tax=Friedmanniomyces endolithicus TaxID=329885 RepID=A0AAN6G187_9PEZI|nr:hypothetical protein LTR35_012211 [Friedmanniomyces endolithicus]KAK0285931.1 hypothetical protein LTS00_010722 [Friedmanniomyces endolithicus]KAK0327310.1 hypothetical protein LTR82_002073 [Friedmanniomyces endolithicus]KAK1016654.1 hypothetical protein LTR54_003333 [Friedmanniomyces endolithicus]
MFSTATLALLALSSGFATLTAAQSVSGQGQTTRYWDCCKGSCAWTGKADVSAPITTCDIHDKPLTDANAASGCTSGGTAYMCSDQSPWAVNDTMAYGFAAVSIPGGTESSWCCACYELTFTSTAIAGKKMIVQATNTGADLASGQFDLAIPGGGVGIYNGCTDEWGAPASGWGAQYGGISSNTCSSFPSALQPGCNFRFGSFFEGADNPAVDYKQVTCPKALTDKTGCVRAGETPTGGDAASSSAVAVASSSSVAAASSASSVKASSSSVAAVSASSASAKSSSAAAATTYSSSKSSVAAVSASSASSKSSATSISKSSPAAVSASSASSKTASAPAAPSTYKSSAVSTSRSVATPSSSSSHASSSSVVAPVSASSSAASHAHPSPSSEAHSTMSASSVHGGPAPSGHGPAPSGSLPGSGEEGCAVQYVYEYDL